MPAVAPLPFVRRPHPNELLTSWLNRVAGVYGSSWPEFHAEINKPKLPWKEKMPWMRGYHGRDSWMRDYGGSNSQFAFLSALTQLPAKAIRRLDLACRFPGRPVQRFLCHLESGLAVPDFCPACLRDDLAAGRDNYLRIEWAVAGVSHCHVHGLMLRSECPRCLKAPIPRAGMSQDVIRLLCGHCEFPLWQAGSYDFEHTTLSRGMRHVEEGILRLLREKHARLGVSFRVYQDLAFLLFANRLGKSANLIKDGLGCCGKKPALGLITPALRRTEVIGDLCYVFPLSTTVSTCRADLLKSAIAIASRQRGVLIKGVYWPSIRARIADLFDDLTHPLKEELVCRANHWPAFLRKQVKQAIHRPGMYHPARWDPKPDPGWLNSEYRRWANGGRIPRYERL